MEKRSPQREELQTIYEPSRNTYQLPSRDTLWRTKLSKRGLRETPDTALKISSIPSDIQLPCKATSLAVHNNKHYNYFAHGGNDGVQIISADPKHSGSGLDYQKLSFWPTPNTVHDVDWQGNIMLVGSDQGTVYICRADPDRILESNGSDQHQWKTAVQVTPESRPPVSPGQWPRSNNIRCVRLCDNDPDKYLALENTRLHLCSVSRSIPSSSVEGSFSPLFAADWSPHSAHHFVLGGASGTIKLLDARSVPGPVPWKISNAHNDAIRDIQYSPLVPYWVATASSDGLIRIWDTRYPSGHLMELAGHNNLIRKISWSQNYCELISSAGADRQIKLWSLKLEPHHVLGTVKEGISDTAVGLGFSPRHKPGICFALTRAGEFTGTMLTPTFMKPLALSRYPADTEHADERNVEQNIYHRNFLKAFSDVPTIVEQQLKPRGEYDRALDLLEMCKFRKPMPHKEIRTRAEAEETFRSELYDFSYYIPPSHPTFNIDTKGYDNQFATVGRLSLNIRILRHLQRGDLSAVLQMEQLELALREDASIIDEETLLAIVRLYIAHEFYRGIDFFIQINKFFQTDNEFDKYANIAKKILSPLTYDVRENTKRQESGIRQVSSLLADRGYVITQLSLLRDIITYLNRGNAEDIISRVESCNIRKQISPHLSILSVPVLRAYLNALLFTNQFASYFIVGTEIMQNYPSYDVSSIINHTMHRAFNTKMAHLLDTYRDLQYYDESRPSETLSAACSIIFHVASILYKAPNIPEWMRNPFTDGLDKITDNVVSFVRESSSAAVTALSTVGNTVSKMEQLREGKPGSNDFIDVVNKSFHVLQRCYNECRVYGGSFE